MKPASIALIKKSLKELSKEELLAMTLKLATFKVDNKAFLSYLLFYQTTPELYVDLLKKDMTLLFEQLNQDSSFYVRKGLRKIEREINKQIKFIKDKNTEVELLTTFLQLFRTLVLKKHQQALDKIFERVLLKTLTKTALLHEDLQYDYRKILTELT